MRRFFALVFFIVLIGPTICAQSPPLWHFTESKSELDGKVHQTMLLEAPRDTRTWTGKAVRLGLAFFCDGSSADREITFGFILPSGFNIDHRDGGDNWSDVRFRFKNATGSQSPISDEPWRVGDDWAALAPFLQADFIEDAQHYDYVIFEFSPSRASTETVTFDLHGFRKNLNRLTACHVPPPDLKSH
jgi:hypothetical protein